MNIPLNGRHRDLTRIQCAISTMIREKKYLDLWEMYLLPNGVPLLAGGMAGVLLAFLITRGFWFMALALVSAVPVVILLNIYPMLAAMIWFLLMPFLPFETVSPSVFWVLHRALIPLALGMTILSRMLKIKKYSPVQLGWAELSMVIYLTIGAVSILLTRQAPLEYLYELYDTTFVPFAAYWLIRILGPGERDLKRLILIMLPVCTAEIVIGFWARYVPESLPALWAIPRMGTRMSGTSTNPTPYAYLLMFCMVFLFHEAMNREKGPARLFLVLTFNVGLLCIFLTFTRGCWVAAMLVLLGLLYLYPKPMLSLLAVAVVVIAISSTSILADEVSFALKRFSDEGTVASRIVLAHAGEQMFYARPFFGWGFGNYDRYDWQFMELVGNAAPTDWDIHEGTSHNTYLTILAEMGIVGFFFQFFPLIWWLGPTVKALRRLPREGFWSQRLLIIMWLSVVFYLVSSQVMDMRFFWYHIGLWWMTLGLIASMVQTCLEPGDTGEEWQQEQLSRTVSR